MSERTERNDALAVPGAKLQEWRKNLALTQAEAAKLINASQGAWGAWEVGTRAPDLHSAFAIEKLTKGEIKAVEWAVRRATSNVSDQTGPQQVVTAADADALTRAG